MFLYVLVILFPIIGSMSMDSACHKQCVYEVGYTATVYRLESYRIFNFYSQYVMSRVNSFHHFHHRPNLLVTHIPNFKGNKTLQLYHSVM